MTNIDFKGKEITLTTDADFTNRVLDGRLNYHEVEEGERFYFEMSADGMDDKGNKIIVYWIFNDIKGDQRDLDDFDYGDIDRIETV